MHWPPGAPPAVCVPPPAFAPQPSSVPPAPPVVPAAEPPEDPGNALAPPPPPATSTRFSSRVPPRRRSVAPPPPPLRILVVASGLIPLAPPFLPPTDSVPLPPTTAVSVSPGVTGSTAATTAPEPGSRTAVESRIPPVPPTATTDTEVAPTGTITECAPPVVKLTARSAACAGATAGESQEPAVTATTAITAPAANRFRRRFLVAGAMPVPTRSGVARVRLGSPKGPYLCSNGPEATLN